MHSATFKLGNWLVEPDTNRIVRDGEIVKIDPRNMRLLQLLTSRPRQVFSQAEIERAVWSDVIVTPNSVYQSIAQLRRALGDETANPKYIETIARKGYRVIAELNTVRENVSGADRTVGDLGGVTEPASDPEISPHRCFHDPRFECEHLSPLE